MRSRNGDILRQSGVISAATFMLIGAAVGGGAFGGEPVAELQDGALSAQGSPLAPAGPAFAIWTLIYVGLAAYTIWQALPARRADERQRAVGWWIAASMVLNGLWLVAARFGPLFSTVLVIAGLLAVLARIIVLLGRTDATGFADTALTEGVSGLHFGWVTIATVANAAAWLAQVLPEEIGAQGHALGVIVLVVVAAIGTVSALVTQRLTPALATSWGIAWVAVGRIGGEPQSTPIGIAAVVVAVVILVAGIVAVSRRKADRVATT
ncbi:TspO/MBR family protein [Microbacterium sp. NPDC055903]